ncbi:MAG: DUF6569 family protein [Candidatus Korobacteraceae bacterium]
MNHTGLASMAFLLSTAIAGVSGGPTRESLHILAPITHGNLTIFPIVGGVDYDTSRFLTLDEGVRAGTVIVTEQGSVQGLLRRGQPVNRGSGAAVNQLVLINNSDQPLLLLAGEIVTGGKQDRVIGADRLVPPKSDPIDLSVFCVEPGRWVGRSERFSSMKSQMAQPSVRVPAMAAKDQHQVWNQVAAARKAAEVASAAPLVQGNNADLSTNFDQNVVDNSPNGGNDLTYHRTTSYAATMAMPKVQATIDSAAGNYESIREKLKKDGAKGVVVAINGKLVWVDLFASNDLLMRYWQKLVRSYAAESLTSAGEKGQVDQKSAEAFLDRMSGSREVVETEAGIYRRAEITGDNYKVFSITALMPKTDFDVHIAKMTYDAEAGQAFRPAIMVR